MAVETATIQPPQMDAPSVPIQSMPQSSPNLSPSNALQPTISTASTLPAGTPAPQYRVLTTADYKGAGLCLANAFKDDGVCTYAIDSDDAKSWTAEQRWALHVRTFECATYAHILSGIAVGVDTAGKPGEFDAVALWMPPGRNMDDWFTLIRSGLWRLKFAYTKEGRERFYGEFLPLLNQTKADVLGRNNGNSWYLVYLATREEARGRGLARALIRYGTERADAQGLQTYLESSHRSNVPYYRRFGFEIKKMIKLKRGDCAEMDIMVRNPGQGKL